MAGSSELARSVMDRVAIPPGPVVVALSGGADSAVLAWVAVQSNSQVRAVFVNHHLAHSDDLRRAAQAIADALGLGLTVADAPVDRAGPSFESVARDARYAVLRNAAESELILTGHTADDQAETVMSHFLRGAGARGLAGIPAEQDGLARPLLAISREETRFLAKSLELPVFDDPDNLALAVRRNRIRSELLPRLETEFNPQLKGALVRTARLSRADDLTLESRAQEIPIAFDGECVKVPAALLHDGVLPEAVATRVLRRALVMIRGPHGGSQMEVERLLEVARGASRGNELAGGLRAEREGPWLTVTTSVSPPRSVLPVTIPFAGEFDRWRVSLVDGAREFRLHASGVHALDRDLLGGDLFLRPAEHLGSIDIAAGSKAIAVALTEAGVPRRLRARWPVLWAADRVAGIPGIRAAFWAQATKDSTRYLVVSLERIAPS